KRTVRITRVSDADETDEDAEQPVASSDEFSDESGQLALENGAGLETASDQADEHVGDEASAPEPVWTPDQERRRDACLAGWAVVANQRADHALIAWAHAEGRLAWIDRHRSEWGNPYEVDVDGDRDFCCDAFRGYLTGKRSLLARIPELRGKA